MYVKTPKSPYKNTESQTIPWFGGLVGGISSECSFWQQILATFDWLKA